MQTFFLNPVEKVGASVKNEIFIHWTQLTSEAKIFKNCVLLCKKILLGGQIWSDQQPIFQNFFFNQTSPTEKE